MITKFEKYNESISSLLVGPTEEEVLNNLKKLNPIERMRKSIKNNFLDGFISGFNDVKLDNDIIPEMLSLSCNYNRYDISEYMLNNYKFDIDYLKDILRVTKTNSYDSLKIYNLLNSNIKKLLKENTNESISSLLVGPTIEEIKKNMFIYPTNNMTSFIHLVNLCKRTRSEIVDVIFNGGVGTNIRGNALQHYNIKYDEIFDLCKDLTPHKILRISIFINNIDMTKYALENGAEVNQVDINMSLFYIDNNIIELLKNKKKNINESISSLLVGPTKEEVWTNLMNGEFKGLLKNIPESPEDFFNQIKDGCEKMGNGVVGVIWGKNGIRLFQEDLENGFLWINAQYIWFIFYTVYNFKNYGKIVSLMNRLIEDDINWNELSPHCWDEEKDPYDIN